MKNGKLKLFSLILCCLLLAFSFNFKKSNVFADEVLVNYITSEAEFLAIKDNNAGSYILSNDITLQSSEIQNFEGVLDGDGHTIFVKNVFSIFGTLTNAVVKNVKIIYDGINAENGFDINSSFGMIANKLSGKSKIYNVECDFSVKTVITDEFENSKTVVSPIELNLNGSYSVGSFFGESYDGAEIYNCVSLSCFKVKQIDSNATFTYVGGVIGKSENTNIYNVIVNSQIELSHQENNYSTKLAVGGICGYFTGVSNTLFKNCVVGGSLNQNVNLNTGAFVGLLPENSVQLPNPNQSNSVTGLVSVMSGGVLGFGANNIFTENLHYKLNEKVSDYNKVDVYKTDDIWDITKSWNLDSVWKEGIKTFETGEQDERYYLLLQCFETFRVEVNNYSDDYLTDKFLKLSISVETDDVVEKGENYAVIKYGKPFQITATFNEIIIDDKQIIGVDDNPVKYDVFFELGENLKLDKTLEKLEGVSFSQETATWTIPSMQDSFEGSYSVELKTINYTLKATAISEDGEVKGHIGRDTNNATEIERDLTLSYGKESKDVIKFVSKAEKYFASAGFEFYPSMLDENLEYVQNIEQRKDIENITTQTDKRFEFYFNENDAFTTEYLLKNCDFSSDVIGYVNALFTSNVCQLYFEFELDGEVINETMGIKILIDGEELTKTGEEFVKKVIKDKNVTISVLTPNFDKKTYKFVCLKDDLDNEYITDLDIQSYFDYNSSGLESSMFKVCIERVEDATSNNSIWWIVGGIGGGILVIAICWILIVKFKDNSYRNMYNRF